jgi:hypothetical protein
MSIDFDNIFGHVIPMDNFRLKWRFTDKKFDKLPDQDLNNLQPLDSDASMFLWNYIAETNLHSDMPFKRDFFRTIDNTKILDDNQEEIKRWLYHCGLQFDKPVFLSWDTENAMIVPWQLLIKYFDSFYYHSSDDLTVIDQSLDWALLFFHNGEVYFGTNTDFKLSEHDGDN